MCALFVYRGFIFEAVADVSVLALLHALTLVEAGICGGKGRTHTHKLSSLTLYYYSDSLHL